MNKRMVITLGAGLVVTMVITIVAQALLSPKKEAVAEAPQVTQILVASQDIPVGTELSDYYMQWIEWPETALFPSAIKRQDGQEASDAISGILVRRIEKGEPIVESALVSESKGNFLAASLGTGMRAMAIRVSAESSVGGFVTPGDKVDVIMTYQVRVPADDEVRDAAATLVSRNASQTVLENVRVLAVDQEAKPKDNAKIARTVTLEVDSKGSETLALASSMGDLSLVLRKLGDETHADANEREALTTDVLMSNVLRQLTGGQNNRESRTVRVYNGPNLDEQVIRARIGPPVMR